MCAANKVQYYRIKIDLMIKYCFYLTQHKIGLEYVRLSQNKSEQERKKEMKNINKLKYNLSPPSQLQ